MAGLMLADRTASVEDELRQTKAKLLELQAQAAPQTTDTLADLVAQAEALADLIEQRAQ